MKLVFAVNYGMRDICAANCGMKLVFAANHGIRDICVEIVE